MAPTDTMTEAPKLDLFDGTGIAGGEDQGDAPGQLDGMGWPDSISDDVGRPGYLGNHTVDECLLPTEDEDGSEAAEFDRYYFPDGDGEEPVLVDLLPGGSDVERVAQEAEKRVVLKREWCEARGVTYKVVIDTQSPVTI